MTNEPENQRLRPEDLPRHPTARPRAEADRELVPPDADFDTDSDSAAATGARTGAGHGGGAVSPAAEPGRPGR